MQQQQQKKQVLGNRSRNLSSFWNGCHWEGKLFFQVPEGIKNAMKKGQTWQPITRCPNRLQQLQIELQNNCSMEQIPKRTPHIRVPLLDTLTVILENYRTHCSKHIHIELAHKTKITFALLVIQDVVLSAAAEWRQRTELTKNWWLMWKHFRAEPMEKRRVYADVEKTKSLQKIHTKARKRGKKTVSSVLVHRQGNRSHSNKVRLDQVRESQRWLTAQQKKNTHFSSPSCVVLERRQS